MTYIPGINELVEVVEVHTHDHCPAHAPGDVVEAFYCHPCKDGLDGFPKQCAAREATCVYLRSEPLPAVGTWCNVKPANVAGLHATHWLRAIANAVRATMQADPELAVTWLETARGLEEFACEFDGIAARIADATGLTLPPRE
jgi:hypothetical protein